jgi:hypothetical protein
MTWITWIARGVDHLACAWLITRVLDLAPVVPVVPIGIHPRPHGLLCCAARSAQRASALSLVPARSAVQP